MICAIHQPNFFPWLGYFDKIQNSDVFVFLDGVDYPKSSKTMATWSNRVAIAINETPSWISIPVIREKGIQKINKILINDEVLWREKLIKTLEYNYKKAKRYDEVAEFIFSLINYKTSLLAEYNYHSVIEICKKMQIDCCFYKQTELETNDSSTRLLIEITKMLNCDTYMCGGGAKGYQEDQLFEQENVKLVYQQFKQPFYEQGGHKYIEGLSIIDVLFHCGFEETKKLIMGI